MTTEDIAVDADLKPCDLATLATFEFERVLSESTLTGSAYLLGTLHGEPAIVHVQRTALDSAAAPALVKGGLESMDVFLDNRPYFSAHALIARGASAPPDLSLKLIWPCTEVHIKKHTAQERRIVRETPAAYAAVVEPYISSFPPERTAWVHAILDGVKEAERVVYRSPADEEAAGLGFVLIPDLKWDGTTLASLYLSAIVRDGSIRSLRDLRPKHIPLLRRIRAQAYASTKEKYGVEPGQLRIYVHYQPSYYHFHVHVVHVRHEVTAGMAAGQAHLLEDVINWLELSPAEGPCLVERMTLTYALGVEHGLYTGLQAFMDEEDRAAGAGGAEGEVTNGDKEEKEAEKEDGKKDGGEAGDATANIPETGHAAEDGDAECAGVKRKREDGPDGEDEDRREV